MKYYIAENGQPAGPFEPHELLAHGLTVNSLVWGEGMPNWMSASQVPELMAVLSGTTFNPGGPGNFDVPLPQMPPVGTPTSPLPQVPPFGGATNQPTTPYGQGTTNKPYSPPQYGPSNQPNQVMPKTWLTEAVIATVMSLLCLCNIIGVIPGVIAIFKANSVKAKFMQGDVNGATVASASAKKWVIITVVVIIAWSLISGFRMMNDNSLFNQVVEGAVGSLYGL